MAFERLKPGQTALKADAENAVKSAVEALLNFTGADMIRTGTGFHFRNRRSPATPFDVRVNAALGPRGLYSGFIFNYGSTPIDPALGITLPGMGTVGAEAIYILCVLDLQLTSASGHILTDAPQTRDTFPAHRWWPGGASDGKRVAVIYEIDYQTCDTGTTAAESLGALNL